jgi:hypothetical protein
MKYTVDDTTVASIPGGIPVSLEKFMRYYDIDGWQGLKLRLISLLPKATIHRIFKNWLPALLWLRINEQFMYGCINPAIVIHKDQGLMAVFTNLTSVGNNPTPVIKIYKERLDLIKFPDEIYNGLRLATVSLYEKNMDDPYATSWIDFSPLLSNCFTDDSALCNKALQSISAVSWQCLETGLKQVSEKDKEGLYHVELDKELTNIAY